MAEIEQEKLGRIQLLEQTMHGILQQKQQFQMEQIELDNALKELDTAEDAFKIMGNLMIKTDKSKLQEQMKEKKELADLRLKSIEKQEKELSEQLQEMQKEAMKK